MLILTGNDVGPNTMSLMILGLVLLVLGALMNANIFGEMVSIFQQMNVGEMKVAEQLNNATTTMRNI